MRVLSAPISAPIESGGTVARPDPKLVDGAHQFEAMMLGEMLKGQKFGALGMSDEGDDAQAGADGTLRSMGTEAVAKAISAGGGFGLARQIVRQVSAQLEHSEDRERGTKVL